MGLLKDIGGFVSGGGALGGGISALTGQGIGDLYGDALTGGAISNAKSVEETNRLQMQLADQQMGFQREMSNTAYQRAMEDMRKAGLNPMLAMDKGGASTPSGAMATVSAPRKGDIGAGLFNTAKAVVSQGADIQQSHSQTNLNKANAVAAEANADKITANAQESRENTRYTQQLQKKAKYETQRSRAEAKASELETEVKEVRKPIDKELAPFDAVMDRVSSVFGSLGSGLRALTGQRGNSVGRYERYKKQYQKEELKALGRAGSKGIPLK